MRSGTGSKAGRWVLGRAGRLALGGLARGRPLIALDYDGTLCPIRRQPGAALPSTRTLQLLDRVCALYPTAIISGRALGDLKQRLGAVRPTYLVGNHGLEPGPRLAFAAREVSRARERLTPALADWSGVELEDKRYSLSLHYRRSPKPERERARLIRLAGELAPGLRQVEGKRVLNLVPRGGDKGAALLRLLARSRRRRSLYVGDDLTDEDVFRLPRSTVLSVRVGRAAASAAGWYLERRGEVDLLLAALIELAGAAESFEYKSIGV